jgi:hypothetical protein
MGLDRIHIKLGSYVVSGLIAETKFLLSNECANYK